MRTFVQLRRLMDSNRDLARKIGEMEESVFHTLAERKAVTGLAATMPPRRRRFGGSGIRIQRDQPVDGPGHFLVRDL